LLLTPSAFLSRYQGIFADNDTFDISAADLRSQARDLVELFTLWSKLGQPLLLSTLDDLATVDQRTLVVGQGATVANATNAWEAQFILRKDSNGPLWAFASIGSSTRVRVRWLPVGDLTDKPQFLPVLQLDDYPYKAGDAVQHTFPNGQTRLLEIKVDLPLAGSQTNPTPTGLDDDPYYVNFASLASDDDLPFQWLTTSQFTTLIRESKLKPARFYRLMRYELQEDGGDPGGFGQAPPRAEFDVVVRALSSTDYAPEGWAIDNGTGAVLTAGTYELATDTFTAGSGSTYWSTLPASANDATPIAAYVSGRLLSYVPNNDARLNDARRIITVRRNSGEYYTGADGNLLEAVRFAGEHSLIILQQVYNLEASFTLPRGVCLDGRYRYFRVESHRLTMSRQSALVQSKLEYVFGEGGDLYSAFGANNAETPQLRDCEIRVNVHVAANCFLRLVNCDLVFSDWNRGAGTVILENCREFGARGSGPDFAAVQVVGAVAVPADTAVVLTQNTSYHFSSGPFAVDPNGRVVGAVATVLVAAGVVLPASLSSAPFVLPPASGDNDLTKERLVRLEVLRDLRILTNITPLS
jgi:hypothetical protein